MWLKCKITWNIYEWETSTYYTHFILFITSINPDSIGFLWMTNNVYENWSVCSVIIFTFEIYLFLPVGVGTILMVYLEIFCHDYAKKNCVILRFFFLIMREMKRLVIIKLFGHKDIFFMENTHSTNTWWSLRIITDPA